MLFWRLPRNDQGLLEKKNALSDGPHKNDSWVQHLKLYKPNRRWPISSPVGLQKKSPLDERCRRGRAGGAGGPALGPR